LDKQVETRRVQARDIIGIGCLDELLASLFLRYSLAIGTQRIAAAAQRQMQGPAAAHVCVQRSRAAQSE